MTLGSTQPLTEMSTRNASGDKAWPALETETSPPSVSQLSKKCGNFHVSHPYRPAQSFTGIILSFLSKQQGIVYKTIDPFNIYNLLKELQK
jgi:hypothetical protein